MLSRMQLFLKIYCISLYKFTRVHKHLNGIESDIYKELEYNVWPPFMSIPSIYFFVGTCISLNHEQVL